MNVHWHKFRTFQPLLLSPAYGHRGLPKAEFRPFTFICSAHRRPVQLWARSRMDRHVDIHATQPPHLSTPRLLQQSLNASSRWVTVAVILAVFVLRHDDQVIWALTGSIMNSLSSKLLKRMFNQQRPLTALGLKADPGMPSSHAQSFGFLGFYAAVAVILWKGFNILGVASASSVLLCCTYLAWLRYAEGLHTLPQVVVGAGFGCCTAAIWIALWHYLVREVVTSSIVYHHLLVGLFALLTIGFIAFGVRKWRFGEA
ncbi:hypothetical protein GOP47_0011087 [Adiantum capillus-veneris]|uniref:Phosphatidic acid phosphatase type 2/haloperoxidase domain-containing protein n=1 Tax=Adiantum capillus-veneris TaxID=13818 RepID=A0A9D4ZF31_ADICA|nr:hypothetical protein GOP47_0011087 [Adiantum capillus-veneris]